MFVFCNSAGHVVGVAAEYHENLFGHYVLDDTAFISKVDVAKVWDTDTSIPEDFVPGKYLFNGTEFIKNDNWIEPAQDPEPPEEPETETLSQRVTSLEQQNKMLQAQLEASIQSNQLLEDCLVEMAGVVYA